MLLPRVPQAAIHNPGPFRITGASRELCRAAVHCVRLQFRTHRVSFRAGRMHIHDGAARRCCRPRPPDQPRLMSPDGPPPTGTARRHLLTCESPLLSDLTTQTSANYREIRKSLVFSHPLNFSESGCQAVLRGLSASFPPQHAAKLFFQKNAFQRLTHAALECRIRIIKRVHRPPHSLASSPSSIAGASFSRCHDVPESRSCCTARGPEPGPVLPSAATGPPGCRVSKTTDRRQATRTRVATSSGHPPARSGRQSRPRAPGNRTSRRR